MWNLLRKHKRVTIILGEILWSKVFSILLSVFFLFWSSLLLFSNSTVHHGNHSHQFLGILSSLWISSPFPPLVLRTLQWNGRGNGASADTWTSNFVLPSSVLAEVLLCKPCEFPLLFSTQLIQTFTILLNPDSAHLSVGNFLCFTKKT